MRACAGKAKPFRKAAGGAAGAATVVGRLALQPGTAAARDSRSTAIMAVLTGGTPVLRPVADFVADVTVLGVQASGVLAQAWKGSLYQPPDLPVGEIGHPFLPFPDLRFAPLTVCLL
jgi:hypothetical protein